MAAVTPRRGPNGITLFDDFDLGKNEEGGWFLREDVRCEAPFLAGDPWELEDDEGGKADVSKAGLLTVRKGFRWDGPSIPDGLRWVPGLLTDNFIGPSCFHDAIARRCRQGEINYRMWKLRADTLLVGLCEIEGMWWPKREAIALAMRTDKARRAFTPQPATDAVFYVLP